MAHGILGWVCGVCAFAVLAAPLGARADAPDAARRGSGRIEEVIVRGRSDSLVGTARSASEGLVGAEQLERRTLARPGELLETVPGVIVTQHSGAGKANQFFLRGFNLDHGTDFATSLDGVPVNLRSHGHGGGYTDLNFLIPELVQNVEYDKGVYYADHGDFSSAGAADLAYFDVLPSSLASVEVGSFGYQRALLAASPQVGEGALLYGVELFRNDGAYEHGDDYGKLNGVLRYSRGDEAWGWNVTASAYQGDWDATEQVAARAVRQPGFDRFDTLDSTDRGDSRKYMLYGQWHRRSEASASRIVVYGFRQELDLVGNFTYFLTSPDGDQILQTDDRWVSGADARHTWLGTLCGRAAELTAGLQLRVDQVENGLFQTVNGERADKLDYDGNPIPAVSREDDILETSASPYLETRIEWTDHLRTVLGVRADFFSFDSHTRSGGESGSETDALVSPKATVILGPWSETELYLSAGTGFHSNDARGVTAREDAADPLVRTRGAEVGMRSTLVDGLQSTVAFWWLESDAELLFVGDAGATEASRPSERYGAEFANYYTATEWLTFDADFSMSRAQFTDSDPAGDEVPGALEAVVALGMTVHDLGPWSGELRGRYFGPRPLIEDDSERSGETVLVSAKLGYQLSDTWSLSAEVFNLLNRDDSEIDYFYPSRLRGEDAGPDDGGVNDIHLHPADPISFRIGISARF
jgi:hypothetical protein